MLTPIYPLPLRPKIIVTTGGDHAAVGWADCEWAPPTCRENEKKQRLFVGSDGHSWGLTHSNSRFGHCAWKSGDAIGIAADLETGILSFSINNRWQHDKSIIINSIDSSLRPALSFGRPFAFIMNLGERPFESSPPFGYLP